ncbi:MAG TPA: ATP-binding protein [Gemmatimonadaceae bacterium]|nr:ATP-binding protein [Gemmatimonadaceae bacterium]
MSNSILRTTALVRAPQKREIEPAVAHVATFQSIQLRLPLSMTALLAAAVIAAMGFAYAQVRRSAVSAANEKLKRSTEQVAELLATSATGMGGAMRREGQKPEFSAFLTNSSAATRARAAAALDSMPGKSKQLVDVQLWNDKGETVLASPQKPAVPADIRAELLRINPARDSGIVGRIHLVADTPVFVVAAPVVQSSKVIGYFVERGRLSTSPTGARAIATLIGEGSGVYISNNTRDVWSDFWVRATPPPHAPPKPGMIHRFVREGANGGERYGLEQSIKGTPWLLLVELPRAAVLGSADAFLRDATIFAALLLAIGAFGLWRLSRNITRPLSDLREAAIAITDGDYSRHVELPRSDELGELGRAFTTMANRVSLAQHALQQQLATIEESEARYRKITEASFDGIDVVVDDVVREANRGFAQIFGYSVHEVIGRPVSDFVAEESLALMKERATKQQEGMYEFCGKHKSGRKLILEGMTKIHNIDGRPGRISAFRDVTEKRSLEGQFRQAQKMEAVGRLAGGVAHDFNNLLTVIMSCTDLLLTEVKENSSQREDLEQIKQASVAAASLTQQLLAFSRQEVIQPRLIEVNSVVTSAHGILKRLLGEDIELTTVLTLENPVVKIDRSQLEQVIVNLAVNARDAMPSGGKLTIETQTADVDEAYATSHWSVTAGHYAVLAVTDTGCGMDEETQARIFEPFYTTKEVGKGTGLGLSMVYGTVKQSGGFIWVYSEVGNGTTFKIYLPLTEEDVASRESKRLPAETSRGTEVIVLAEDSPAVRSTARNILERAGYTVFEAPNGRTALEIARKRATRIHMLLTDVVMPEMSGRKLSEEFAAIRTEAKVLFMSGYTDDAIVRHGVMSAGVDYLQKPFSGDALLRKVREVLDRKNGHR